MPDRAFGAETNRHPLYMQQVQAATAPGETATKVAGIRSGEIPRPEGMSWVTVLFETDPHWVGFFLL